MGSPTRSWEATGKERPLPFWTTSSRTSSGSFASTAAEERPLWAERARVCTEVQKRRPARGWPPTSSQTGRGDIAYPSRHPLSDRRTNRPRPPAPLSQLGSRAVSEVPMPAFHDPGARSS